MRTVSVSPTGPTEGAPEDLDGKIVDGVESLRQRVVQAFKFRLGEWFIDGGRRALTSPLSLGTAYPRRSLPRHWPTW